MKRLPLAVALLATAFTLGWQALTVHYNYGGNWTALFCTGGIQQMPPWLDGEGIYRFKGSFGYDGQFYHYQAHDPFLRRGTAAFIDSPTMRYRRILVPLAAYLLAGGQDRFVDAAYVAVILLAVFAGAYWSSLCAQRLGRHPACGFAFLLVPATLISVDRLVVDVALVALVAAFACYEAQGPSWKLWAVLALAPLARETGVFLLVAYCFYLLWRRWWLAAALYSTSCVPALAWWGYVQLHTPGREDIVRGLLSHGINPAWPHPASYPFAPWISVPLMVLDWAVLAAIGFFVLLSVRSALRGPASPVRFAAMTYAVAFVWAGELLNSEDPFTLPRVTSPLPVLATATTPCAGIAVMAVISLRVLAQLLPQVLGVLRGLVS